MQCHTSQNVIKHIIVYLSETINIANKIRLLLDETNDICNFVSYTLVYPHRI